MRQGHLSLPDAESIAQEAEALMKGRECEVESERVLRLAQSSKRSAYDCEFVALAQELEVRLVTSDNKLLAAFPSIAVSMEALSAWK